jgi:hypothetical protein
VTIDVCLEFMSFIRHTKRKEERGKRKEERERGG